MGRATANPSPNNPNTYGQPPPSPPQFAQPPPQFYHQEQVTADYEAQQTSHEVPPPSSETYTDHHDHDHDDEDHSQMEMVPYDDLSPSEPPQPQIASQQPPPPPPQQVYPPKPPPQKPQPNSFQQYPPQQNAFQGTYPPQGKQQPPAYPPPPNAQGPVQFPPPQPQEPVLFPPQMNNHQATHTPHHQMNGTAGIPPSPYKANVPVQVGTEAWSSDLFACMDDPESAILTAFCPCMTFGQIAEITDNGQTSCATSGSLYGLVALTLMTCLIASPYRQKLRARYNLMESPLPDWLAHWLFPWCALCQEYRELQHRGFEPSIGWVGNVARAQMMQQQQQNGMTPPVNQAMSGL